MQIHLTSKHEAMDDKKINLETAIGDLWISMILRSPPTVSILEKSHINEEAVTLHRHQILISKLHLPMNVRMLRFSPGTSPLCLHRHRHKPW